MTLSEEAYLLRIYVGESDKVAGKPLYEWIVNQAHQKCLAGATAIRGMIGFGANSRCIQTFKIERLSQDLPVVIEIVDNRENLEEFLEQIEDRIIAGLAIMEKVQVRIYRSSKSGK
jgi:hypothetical protein